VAKDSTVPKKQRMNNDDNGDSSSSTDDFSLKLKEEVSLEEEEEMYLSADSDEKLLIQRAHSDDGDTFNSKNNDSIRNDVDTFGDGSDSDGNDDEED
jgi:hypothetical protein